MGTLDMLEISPEIATHQLNINPIVHLVHWKKRNFSGERYKKTTHNMDKLLTTGFIMEMMYPS